MQTAKKIDLSLLHDAQDLAISLAKEVGEIQMGALKEGTTIHYKGEVDLVTDADIASEKVISAGIVAVYPRHRITGEEGAVGHDESDYRWLIDPIDGTTNFAHRQPHWAVSICLEYLGLPVMGVIYDVAKREIFTAISGEGAYLNGERIRISRIDSIAQGVGATGVAYDLGNREKGFRLWETFNNSAQAMRRGGAAALDMAWVACGRLDFYFERPINNWDISAGVIICREAGGVVSRYAGDEYHIEDAEVCASNGLLHDQMVQIIHDTVAG